ncbi:MAG: MBG domain-containing protein [Limosilactobacillus pontis]
MYVGVSGEANTVYNGQVQPMTQNQVNELTTTWGGETTAPNGVSFNLTPADFEYVQKDAQGQWQVVQPKEHGTYGARLTEAAIKRLNDQYADGNYKFLRR